MQVNFSGRIIGGYQALQAKKPANTQPKQPEIQTSSYPQGAPNAA
jgi:hypothetical protein